MCGNPHVIAYTASKHAVIGMTKSDALVTGIAMLVDGGATAGSRRAAR
jgi:hypothetical protein